MGGGEETKRCLVFWRLFLSSVLGTSLGRTFRAAIYVHNNMADVHPQPLSKYTQTTTDGAGVVCSRSNVKSTCAYII